MVKKKIMVVDDEKALRLKAKQLLMNDYTVEMAENGQDAIGKISDFHPDLILLDVDMPVLNGLDTCRKIREIKEYRFTKIIFVSGNVTLEDRLAGYEAGADDYILKPYDNDELLSKIKVMLRLEHAEQVSELKSQFLMLISHETRTPLNGIIGFSEILLEEVPEEYQEKVSYILQSGERLYSFIEKVIFLCELKTGKTPVLSKISPEKLIRKIEDKVAGEIEEKGLIIEYDMEEELEINADISLLMKVFQAIFDNAVKFSPASGIIKISVKADNDHCVIIISDQGPGVDKDCTEKIFDEFAIKDIIHHQQGQGISLAIARHIIKMHNGTIKAENCNAGGAVFTVTLPQ